MKRILIVLALLASIQVADAQTNSAAAKKALDAALAASQNAKKAAKVATWTKLAQTYIDAYNAPAGNIWLGASMTELKLAMGAEKPSSEENVVLNGVQYLKQVYSDKNLYFNGNGQLEIIEVSNPVVEDGLGKALDAFKKAAEVDPKGTKTKEITAGIKTIVEKMNQDAYNAYSLGDTKMAASLFESAFAAASQAPYSQLDTNALYNAAFTYWSMKDYPKAKNLFDKCLGLGYYAEGGEVFSKLADCAEKLDTSAAGKELQKNYLEQGFSKFPESESIRIGLINYYLSSDGNTDKLFELLEQAKKSTPENPSLYYVEGNIYKQLGRLEEAAKSYDEAAVVDPDYIFSYIGKGQLFYDKAIELQEEASAELDDNKYMALVKEFETTLKSAIDPFEKAYEVCTDDSIKPLVAEYLKQIYYRFKDQDAKFMDGYNKYNSILGN